jgi:hypothetical protein
MDRQQKNVSARNGCLFYQPKEENGRLEGWHIPALGMRISSFVVDVALLVFVVANLLVIGTAMYYQFATPVTFEQYNNSCTILLIYGEFLGIALVFYMYFIVRKIFFALVATPQKVWDATLEHSSAKAQVVASTKEPLLPQTTWETLTLDMAGTPIVVANLSA